MGQPANGGRPPGVGFNPDASDQAGAGETTGRGPLCGCHCERQRLQAWCYANRANFRRHDRVDSARDTGNTHRALLSHAIDATPAGSQVRVVVTANKTLEVADGGPAVPPHMAPALLLGAVDPSSIGRPANIGLVVASALASDLGATLSLHSDREHTLVRLALK